MHSTRGRLAKKHIREARTTVGKSRTVNSAGFKPKIQKLNINLFPDNQKEKYEKERTKYISQYTKYVPSTREYHEGGFFSSGYYTGEEGHDEPRPDLGEAKWNEMYPRGFDDWKSNDEVLNSIGQQWLIDKVNELVKAVNEIRSQDE